jgi:rod shape-determining protein MreC
MGVVGPQGIVGSVVNVSKNFATVQSMLHYQFGMTAKLKHSNEFGTIEWDGVSPLYVTLKKIPKSVKVEKGDTVVTTQYSPAYPANLMVGTIAEIVPDNTSTFYTLKVKTATNFGTIEYVYVIDNLQHDEQKMLEDSTRKKTQ